AEWFQGMSGWDGWLAYGPIARYQIVSHEPLKIDQAYLFKWAMIYHEIDIVADFENVESNCLSIKALHLLQNGAATPDEEAFLNAVHLNAEVERRYSREPGFRLAEEIRPGFAASIAAALGEDLEALRKQNAMDTIKGSMIIQAALYDVAVDSDQVVLRDDWYDPYTAEKYPQEWIERAAKELAASDVPERLTRARPFFDLIDAERSKGDAAVIEALRR
ncbi:MAG: hypothetical protein ACK5MQ_11830, partial [Pikeienuella sp.]